MKMILDSIVNETDIKKIKAPKSYPRTNSRSKKVFNGEKTWQKSPADPDMNDAIESIAKLKA